MTQQRDLFNEPREIPEPRYAPHVRGSETSKAAAASQTAQRLAGDEERIYNLIAAAGTHGVTCDEVEERTGLSHQTASARVRGLKLKNRIEPSGKKRETRRGCKADVLVAKRGAQ